MFLRNTITVGGIIAGLLASVSSVTLVYAAPCPVENSFEVTEDGTPAAPMLCSSVFSEEGDWYPLQDGSISWTVPDDVTRVSYELMDTPDQEPEDGYAPETTNVLLTEDDLREGAQYLAVQFKNDTGWGAVGYYRIQIDTTAPQLGGVSITNASGKPALMIAATDSISSVTSFTVSIDGGDMMTLSATEATDGYLLEGISEGKHTLAVTAYDAAGNSNTSTTVLNVPAYTDEGKGFSFAVPALSLGGMTDLISVHNSVLAMGALILLILIFYIRAERKRYAQLVAAHQAEVVAVRKRAEANFAALRAELYRAVDTLKAKPIKKSVKKKTAKKRATKKVALKKAKAAESPETGSE